MSNKTQTEYRYKFDVIYYIPLDDDPHTLVPYVLDVSVA